MSVTIKELARQLNIAPSTVSMALNGDSMIAEKTSLRVKELARKLNYVPNNFGRGLQSRRSHLVGYLANSFTETFFNILSQGICETASIADFGVLTVMNTKDREHLRNNIQILLEKNVEGVIVTGQYAHIKDHLIAIEQRNLPMVFCSSADSGKHPRVIIDDFKAGQISAEHLIELGHRNFACSGLYPERLAGNRSAVAEAGLPEPEVFCSLETLEQIMLKKKVTAIIAYSDMEAIQIKHLLSRLGMRIPDDVSLIGFDDLWFAELEEFSFTTIAQPKLEIGRQSMQLLMDIINGASAKNRILEAELKIRNSTAKARC
ncbi:MAG: LacI family DNA-binding transcriptional regulator [Victivallaceae bacterium]|jgi:DNA-binding LacI/PurR family transcriptional regulator